MRILLFGRTGQLGAELLPRLARLGEVVAPARDCRTLCGDLTRPEDIARAIAELRPALVVNAAAMNDVEAAETPEGAALADLVNAQAPGAMARECARLSALFVHFGSDYVFGEGAGPRDEAAPAAPMNAYGRSKLAGERLIREAGAGSLVLRLSWLVSERRRNFMKTILALAAERAELSAADDQTSVPTAASFAAEATVRLIERELARHDVVSRSAAGILHLVPRGAATRHAFARWTVREALALGAPLAAAPEGIRPAPSSAFATRALRPRDSRLANARLASLLPAPLPGWEEAALPALGRLVRHMQEGTQP